MKQVSCISIFPIIVLCLVLFGLISNISCYDNICVKGIGDIVSDTVELDYFSGIEVQADCDVYVSAASKRDFRIEAQQNIIDELKTSIVAEDLVIDFNQCIGSNSGITIYITTPELDYLNVNSSGDLTVEDNFISESFTATLNTSGSITVYDSITTGTLQINCNGSGAIRFEDYIITSSLTTRHSSSGSVYINNIMSNDITTYLSGSGWILYKSETTTQSHTIKNNGSGKIDCYLLPTSEVTLKNSSSGLCWIYVLSQLNISISGSGNVFYKGTPVFTGYSITGSGRLIDENE